MFICIKVQKSIRKVLDPINTFIIVAGCIINIQKSIAISYNNTKSVKNKTRLKKSSTIATKLTKYLGINLTKEIKRHVLLKI